MSIEREMMVLDFSGVEQHSQEVGTDDQHLSATVHVRITANGQSQDCTVGIKEVVGDVGESPLEVALPDYEGRIDYAKFRAAVDTYYRKLVGSQGRAIGIGSGASATMSNNFFGFEWRTFIRLPPKDA